MAGAGTFGSRLLPCALKTETLRLSVLERAARFGHGSEGSLGRRRIAAKSKFPEPGCEDSAKGAAAIRVHVHRIGEVFRQPVPGEPVACRDERQSVGSRHGTQHGVNLAPAAAA